MNKTLCKRMIAVCLVFVLSASAVSMEAAADKAPPDTLPQFCTVIAGTPLTLTSGTDISSVKSSKKSKATVSRSGREMIVKAAETGNATITVTDTDGKERTFDVYTYASQAQYDYLRTIFEGKKFSVLGDSISTLEPWDSGASHYFDTARVSNCGTDSGFVDAAGNSTGGIGLRYQDTYWGNLQTRFHMRLCSNVSCKKKTVAGWMEDDAQIRRLGKRGTPDIIFFYGGSNDILREEEISEFRAAYKNVLKKIKTTYPHAKILALLPYTAGYGPYQRAAIEVCKDKKVTYIALSNADVTALHPNAKGFSKITDCILNSLYAGRPKVPANTGTAPASAADAQAEQPDEKAPAVSGVAGIEHVLLWVRNLYLRLLHSTPEETGLLSARKTAKP